MIIQTDICDALSILTYLSYYQLGFVTIYSTVILFASHTFSDHETFTFLPTSYRATLSIEYPLSYTYIHLFP